MASLEMTAGDVARACDAVIPVPTDIPERPAAGQWKAPSSWPAAAVNWPARRLIIGKVTPQAPQSLFTVPARASSEIGAAGLCAVIFDWGGVLTPPIAGLVRAWAAADMIDWESYVTAVGPWLAAAYDCDGDPNPVHRLERGECTAAEFERLLAAKLIRTDGLPVVAEGILARMLGIGEEPVALMYDLIRQLRDRGLKTALLSNSWGVAGYPRGDFPALFDAVVISGEVGMRKPESRIFRHTVGLLGVGPQECVFVDDIAANIAAAEALGMTGIHHDDPAVTARRLAELFPART
jgi:putative hydrolase of the HAD superfamily